MTIYVDQIKTYPNIKGQAARYGNRWCHMISDTSVDELHEFAARLGMKRAWFQPAAILLHCHYDLVPSRRALAVQLGAVECKILEQMRIWIDEGKLDLLPDGTVGK
jgi:hypothetical protein